MATKNQRLVALAEAEYLAEFVRFAKGDPALSSWEANFVNSVGQRLVGGARRASAKELEKVRQIAAKLGFDQNAPVRIDDTEAYPGMGDWA